MVAFFLQHWEAYLLGLLVGVGLSMGAIAISIVLGTLGAFGRRSGSPFLRAISAGYVAIFRAVPPLLTLFLVFFGLPIWAQQSDIPFITELIEPFNNRVFAAVIAFSLTSGAYTTEIIRAGIESVPEEQVDAAKSIGMSRRLAFFRVIMPQGLKVIAPPLGSEYIYVLKGTSLASVIGVVELMRTAQLAAGATLQNLIAYSMAGMYYVVFVSILQFSLGQLERRFAVEGRRSNKLGRDQTVMARSKAG